MHSENAQNDDIFRLARRLLVHGIIHAGKSEAV
ncbi:hypothetical protein SFHH103_psfHH103d_204 (plasmid) [Sinorhizobium fredii HH103]|nr:hypothetical protein SFHH103_04435 [Sinorhizobium fredii HH103]CEO91402.1 hypothetical protein SFHH103_psfHH103d_204 [Sinorhizobium fredii HH103]